MAPTSIPIPAPAPIAHSSVLAAAFSVDPEPYVPSLSFPLSLPLVPSPCPLPFSLPLSNVSLIPVFVPSDLPPPSFLGGRPPPPLLARHLPSPAMQRGMGACIMAVMDRGSSPRHGLLQCLSWTPWSWRASMLRPFSSPLPLRHCRRRRRHRRPAWAARGGAGRLPESRTLP